MNEVRAIISRCLAQGRRALDEVEARQLLMAYGIPTAPYRHISAIGSVAGDHVARAATELGYPVALKALVPGMLHKTDAGLVALNVRNEAERRAGHACRASRRASPNSARGTHDLWQAGTAGGTET